MAEATPWSKTHFLEIKPNLETKTFTVWMFIKSRGVFFPLGGELGCATKMCKQTFLGKP